MNSNSFSDLQTGLINHCQEIVLVHDVAEVDSCELFDGWLDPGEHRVFIFVEGEHKGNPTIEMLLEDLFRDLQGLKGVGHEHEGEAEEDEPELQLEVILNAIEIHVVNLYLLVIVEELDRLLDILWVQINTENLAMMLFDPFNNSFEWSSSPAADIQKVA